MESSTSDYSSLFYLSPFPKWVYELSTFQILDANEATVLHYGYSRAEFLKLNIKQLCPSEDISKLHIAHTDIESKKGNIYFGIFTHQKKSGEKIRMKINGHKIDFQGKKCVLVVCQDITVEELQAELLKTSEARLQTATSIAKLGYWRLDLQSNILTWSDEIFKIWERERSLFEVSYSNFFDTIHPDDKKLFELEQNAALAGEKELNHVHRILLPHGETKWVHELGCLIKDANGTPIIFEGTVQDISSQKETELRLSKATEELFESESKFRTIFEIASLGIAQVDPTKGRILLVNSFYETITGYSITELLNMNFIELTHPDDREKDWEVFSKALHGKGEYRNEKRYVRKDGSIVWVRLHIAFIRDEEGNPLRTVAICEDISTRKEEEQRIKLLESVVTNTSDAVLITEAEPFDEPGPRILYVNEAFTKMTGYTSEEVIGKTPRILQGPKSDKAELTRLNKALRNWESCEITTVNYKKSGEEFWINFSVSPVANEKGWFTHWIAIEREVTAQKNKELENTLISQISLSLAEENDYLKALHELCKTIGQFGKFDWVELWATNLNKSKVKLLSHYMAKPEDEAFYSIGSNLKSFQKGEGLPGKVWATGKSIHWNDLSQSKDFSRKEAAEKIGLKSVLGIPLIVNNEPLGVLTIGIKQESDYLKKYTQIFERLKGFLGAELKRKMLENDLSHLLEAIPDIISVSDFRGKIFTINRAGCEMLGYNEAEILNQTFEKFIHPQDKEIALQELSRLGLGQTTFNFEVRFISKTGAVIWLSWFCNTNVNEGLIYCTAKNITDEKKLRELNRQTRKLAKIGSWEIDLIQQRLYWSEEVHQLHETNPNSFEPDLETAINFYRDDFRAMVQASIEKSITIGEPFDFEAVIITAKKQERWVRAIGNAELVNGNCQRIYGSFQDIHERKESELRLKSITDDLPGVSFQYIITPDGRDYMQGVSKAAFEVWNLSAAQCEENNDLVWDQIKQGGDFETVQLSIQESISKNKQWNAKWRNILPNGEVRWHEGYGTPNVLTDGTIIFNSLIFDITEKYKAVELYDEASKMAKIGSWELNLVNQGNSDSMYWSPMLKEILEVDKDYNPSLTGGFEFYVDQSKGKIDKAVEHLVQTGESFDLELEIKTVNNKLKWVRCIGKGEFLDGKCQRIFGSYQDIHERKVAEIQLKTLTDNLPGAVFQYVLHPDGKDQILYISEGSYKVWGLSPEDCMLYPERVWLQIQAGGDKEAMLATIQESAQNLSLWKSVWRNVSPDGKVRYYEGQGMPQRLPNGSTLWNSLVLDITDRKLFEQNYLAAQADRVNILESISDAFYGIDEHWNFTYFNKEAENLLFKKSEEVLGKNIWEVFSPAKGTIIEEMYRNVANTGKAETFEYWYPGDGNWYEINAYPSKGGVSAFFKNITEKKEAAEQLLKALEEKNTILESISDNFYALDQQLNFTFMNTSCATLLNVDPITIIGKNLFEEFPNLKNTLFEQELLKVQKTSNSAKFELYYPDFDAWFDENIYATLGGFSVYFLDITKKKRAEIEIQESNERLKKADEETSRILESIGDAFFAVDKNWIVTYWNKEAESLMGRKREEIIGKNLWKMYPDALDSGFFHAFHKGMDTGENMNFEEYYPTLNIWFEVSVYPSLDGLSVYFKDVTLRKEADLRLTQANERFEKVTEATSDAIWDWDIENDTYYRSQNIHRFFGKSTDTELSSKDFWNDAFHPDDLGEIKKSISTALNDPEINRWESEYRVLNEDGNLVYIIDRGLIIRDAKRKAIRMIGAMTDITEQKNHEVQLLALNESLQSYANDLKRSNEELEQFAFITSHDLQEPLRMISSFLDQLRRKYGEQLDDKALQYIHFATDGAKRMRQIILDLLDYSRAGRPLDSLENVDLSEVISDFQQLRRKIISEKSATISTSQLPVIHSYKAAIIQVFHSLLDNAIKYSKEGIAPIIEINASENKEEWKFSIKDNGIGIGPEFFNKIFIIFQRLHNRDEFNGTGIGLSIAKKHIEFLGGKIWLESKLGEGTIFYFTIPKK